MSNYYLCDICDENHIDYGSTCVCLFYETIVPKVVHIDDDPRPREKICLGFEQTETRP
jgi:hypothetical protein